MEASAFTGTLMLPVALPAFGALLALVWPGNTSRPWLVPVVGLLHVGTVAALLPGEAVVDGGGWLVLDALGKLVLATLSGLFVVVAVYVPGYLQHFGHRPNRVFVAAILGFLAAESLVVAAHHLGLMWVAMETATLCTAPLLYFNRHAKSLEATWKFLLISSVGIALALLGSFFLAYASVRAGRPSTLLFEDLMQHAPSFDPLWLRAATALLLVGYATKMGLAPLHTWKPDAYGEAPGLVGALLSGGLSAVAFLAILRVLRIAEAGGQGSQVRTMLLVLGLLSMVLAAVFMVRQRDLKRVLAYSSIEHMGVLAVGIGVGGAAVLGALLHLVANAAGKAVLFLAAANMHRTYGSKQVSDIRGAMQRLPVSGPLFLVGFLASTGAPPFLPFVSLFTILSAMLAAGRGWLAAAFLTALMGAFLGMAGSVLAVLQGTPDKATAATGEGERAWSTVPPLLLFAGLLVLGVWLPPPMEELLHEAVAVLAVKP
jgi:hydrogenase-4 component F